MAVVEKVDGGHGCLVSHQNFLADLYGGKFMDFLFHLKTPYMMDEQAKALSRNGNYTETNKRKRKRNEDIPQNNLVKLMQSILTQLTFKDSRVRTLYTS